MIKKEKAATNVCCFRKGSCHLSNNYLPGPTFAYEYEPNSPTYAAEGNPSTHITSSQGSSWDSDIDKQSPPTVRRNFEDLHCRGMCILQRNHTEEVDHITLSDSQSAHCDPVIIPWGSETNSYPKPTGMSPTNTPFYKWLPLSPEHRQYRKEKKKKEPVCLQETQCDATPKRMGLNPPL